MTELAEDLNIPSENILTPDHLRRVCWRPPSTITVESISEALAELGARNWQIEKTAALLVDSMNNPEPLAPREVITPSDS